MTLPWRALALAGLCAGLPPASAADDGPTGELRLHWDDRQAAGQGPLAEANRLQPGVAPPTPSAAVAEAELRHTLHAKVGGQPWSLGTNLLAWQERMSGAGANSHARVNELHLGTELGAWGLAAGKKVLGWDVGHGFRPNDVVQQETRRTQLSVTPEGRPLIELEHFGSDSASTLVWVNPQRLNSASIPWRAQESALAGRWYQRSGAVDWHAFGRIGEHTRVSVGAAVAWVAGDEVELHASWRAMQRHDGWRIDGTAAAAPVRINPWQLQTLGNARQWLLGLNWTGQQQQGLMVEAWHDGTALPDSAWDAWLARNRGLRHAPAPMPAVAGNLAWQASPFDSASLRRDNLFIRASWQPGPWLWTLDALVQPADGGRLLTAGLQWQGDRIKLNASWRLYGGPANAVMAQLPQRRSGLVAATWAF